MFRLKELRKKAHLTQIEFARAFGVAQNTVSNWENENRIVDSDTAKKLADFFGVTVDYLLGREEAAAVPEVSEAPEAAASDNDIKFALFGGENIEEITDEMMDDVRHYAQFLKEKKKKEK